MKKKIVILTGNELRHKYFRVKLAASNNISVLRTYCEDSDKSLTSKTLHDSNASTLQRLHVKARDQSECDYFGDAVAYLEDRSRPLLIAKGAINDVSVADEVEKLNPDLIVCYGSSLIRSSLVGVFKKRFLNVHLGLSPYYRGSGTNVWPLIDGNPQMVGATFMFIDEGIDTGEIIHQIQADIFIGDSPHTIGNRLIKKMTSIYCNLIENFDLLSPPVKQAGRGKLYLSKDFDAKACEDLYKMCSSRMIQDYLVGEGSHQSTPLVFNDVLRK
jgi:phosphoribosylglycinamide formyltransferase-1